MFVVAVKWSAKRHDDEHEALISIRTVDHVFSRQMGLPHWAGPSIQMYAIVYTDGEQMAKAIATRRRTSDARQRGSTRRAGWVRKNVVMDQRKLDVARRALGVDTETEAIDQALDFVAFREELASGFAAVRRSGGIDDVFERRQKM